ncbi:L-lactate MFS transporter [Desulfuribacillus alkaliarsenatis]|uniref:MFS transporter n=1 Tax=Desulfuribacillus alkaliarsenatis TaxID=766136 RepID=A0A1E5G3K6_9FIRM|nr:OFA family MFS transporter [Desulfuribacillus alkaliarsenatis]OEF97550.1 MFS transporter [Desulfuribacillus alkaliarsenatis]
MKKPRNRWSVVFGALLIQVCLGAVYAWSLFNKPLTEKFGWSTDDVVLTFSITIATFAAFTFFAGKLQDKIGPRLVAMGGGILLGVGLMLASTATSIYQLYFYYGVIGGAGIGAAYVCPIATCVKWFPDRPSLITGVAVAGFGAGGLLFKPIITYFIDTLGVMPAFFYLGLIYLIGITVGAQFLANPTENCIPKKDNADTIIPKKDYSTKEMLKTPKFYVIWSVFFIGCMVGLMVISLAVDIGVNLAQISAEAAGNAIITIALLNAFGRIFWGSVADRFGFRNTLMIIYSLTAITITYMGYVSLTYFTFLVTTSIIGFFFGGFLALFPSKTAFHYGTKNLGTNYGLVYLAYGLSAFAGPILATRLGFINAFYISAVLCLLAVAGIYLIRSISLTSEKIMSK